MQKEIQKFDPNKTYFSVKEGSNYKVTLINRKEHVIEYGHFMKLAKMLNDGQVSFVSINNSIVNKNRIDDIEPTKDKTTEQKKEVEEKQKEEQKREARKRELEQLMSEFRFKYFNEKYGVNSWTYMTPALTRKNLNKRTLTAQDNEEMRQAFAKKHPELQKEIEKLS